MMCNDEVSLKGVSLLLGHALVALFIKRPSSHRHGGVRVHDILYQRSQPDMIGENIQCIRA